MTFLPLPPHDRADEIPPLAVFIAKKIMSVRRSLSTAQDVDEEVELAAQIAICQSAISLLLMAFLTEDASLIEAAKDLYRGL